ncbi:glycine betaine ABC transporter substrate-binding protein [Octadecabacter sp. 1_MG-2023]|uniref:glycine betaine ABC transporter substrate-binding protein n=1 Tax=unclassified Octadecabacter TaxID=196158 RepID=UPI001C0818AD|nr:MULTISPECIES: glycine betaine ABC transporter substrate-binding protein [unclassified Octadecabacter]MBU2993154.1 glycine/betaine ABC transporter substrate-binding protein [Octadecabacter sp. B2R22]MDO6733394.1 glycine betaine ABC transporter substrate-binding protein [Octadecabacter sp. 1_MG-2023]
MTLKTNLLKGAAVAALMTSGSAAYAECGEVTITEMDWASSAVVTAVSAFLLQQGYGCDVQKIPSSTVTAITSITETGEPDILTEVWANSTPAYEGLLEEGKLIELADVLSDGGVEAWWIPAYLAESNPELTTWDGIIANPDLVGGQFHDCPSGWACDIINNNNLIAAGAEAAGIERFQHGSGETLQTSIAAAFDEEAPWFGYYWAPTAVLGKYPMVAVEVPAYNEEGHTCNGDPDCANPVFSAYPASKVVTAVANGFPEREPEAAALMANVSFTNEQMGEVLAWRLDNNASYDEAAVYFLTTYKDVWAGWLDDAAKERLSALLD